MLRIYASGASAQLALTKLTRWVRYLDEVPNIAGLAQLVERESEELGVGGSIPSVSTKQLSSTQ